MRTREIVRRHRHQLQLLLPRHGFRGRPELRRRPRLHFDEDKRSRIVSNDVDFATSGAITTLENCVPEALELRDSQFFADSSELLARESHAGRHVQRRCRARFSAPGTSHVMCGGYVQRTDRSISFNVRRPVSAIAISSSVLNIVMTAATPSAPCTERP